jgi:hypothetical protein
MPCRTKKSSTCLHLLMHIFMVHGVDPLVEEAVNKNEIQMISIYTKCSKTCLSTKLMVKHKIRGQ